MLWYQQNQAIFNKGKQCGDIVLEIKRKVYEFNRGVEIKKNSRLLMIGRQQGNRWQASKIGWIKINIDRAYVKGGTRTTCGGVIKDHLGTWLRGYAKPTRPESVL